MINTLLSDKTIQPKEKTEKLSLLIKTGEISVAQLIEYASISKDPIKATCIEALEFATQKDPSLLGKSGFEFVIDQLSAKAPRIKWESAKVIGNTAKQHNKSLDKAIVNLLINSEHEGTVVRWAAAFALGEIIKLKTAHNKVLVPACEAIVAREEKNSIKKIYLAAFKKI